MKRFALAQALAVEEQLSEDDTRIVAAAAALYEFNDESVNPADDGKEFSPIVISGFIKELLDDLYVPVFEASAVGSLVAMQKHGLSIENDLHRLLVDVNLLVNLDEENADAARVKEAPNLSPTLLPNAVWRSCSAWKALNKLPIEKQKPHWRSAGYAGAVHFLSIISARLQTPRHHNR